MDGNPPIDRGWAWVVLVACFFESVFVFGVIKSFGLLFVQFLEAYHTTSSTVSWIISVQTITFSVIALFVLNVGINYWTTRKFVITGAFVASSSYLFSAFAPNIEVLFLSNGVLFGLAMGLIHGPALVTIGRYFHKYRGLANSIANSGASIGGLAFPPMITYCLDEFGLRGTLMIISAILLNLLVCGSLLRPLELFEGKVAEVDVTEQNDGQILAKKDTSANGLSKHEHEGFETTEKLLSNKEAENEIETYKDNLNLPNGKVMANYTFLDHRGRKMSRHLSYEFLNQETDFRHRTYSTNSAITGRRIHDTPQKPINKVLETLSRSTLALGGDMLGSIGMIPFQTVDHEQSDMHMDGVKQSCCGRCKTISCLDVVSKIIDYRLFKNKVFLVLVFSGLFGMFGSAMLITYIPPHAKDLKLEAQQIALLVSIVSGFDIAGRFVTGIVADTGLIKRHNLICIAFMATGIVCHLTPFFTEFWSMALFSAIYGCFGGVYFSLFPVVIVDFAGLDKLGSGLGIMMVIHGLCISVTVPILGAIRDSTGSYLGSLHMIGACLIVAALVLLLEPLARKLQSNSEKCDRKITAEP